MCRSAVGNWCHLIVSLTTNALVTQISLKMLLAVGGPPIIIAITCLYKSSLGSSCRDLTLFSPHTFYHAVTRPRRVSWAQKKRLLPMWSGVKWEFSCAVGSISIIWFPAVYINSCKGLVSLCVSPLNVSKTFIKQSSCFCNDTWLFLWSRLNLYCVLTVHFTLEFWVI